jgi:plastocyanin
MMKVGALLALALAAVALVACGGGNDTTGETTSGGGGETAAAGGAAGGAEGEGGESVVQIEAVSGSGLEFTEKEVTAKAGKLTVEFTNPQSISHDVAIEDSSGQTLGKTELVSGDKTVETIGTLKPGEYTFYCTVPGHREAGMEGTLKVQ